MKDLIKDIRDIATLIKTTSRIPDNKWAQDERSKSYSTKETYLNILKNKLNKYKDMLNSDEPIDEASTTGSVAGVMTPFAFSKNGIGNEKSGRKCGYEPTYTGKSKNKVNQIVRNRKQLKLDEGVNAILQNEEVDKFEIASSFNEFQSKLNSSSNELKKSFQKKILQKILGKKIKASSSKGQGQIVSDYFINVTGAEIDFYKNKYVIVIIGKEEGKHTTKRYFLNPSSPIVIFGNSDNLKPRDLERINDYKKMFGGDGGDSTNNDVSTNNNVTSDDKPQETPTQEDPNNIDNKSA
jgi:hypothetical protein